VESYAWVLLSHFGSYQEAIWNGIAQVAEEYNANVLCIIAAMSLANRFPKQWILYNLASRLI